MAYTEENNYSNNFLQHTVQLLPIAFTCIAIQAVRLHRLHLHFGIRENLMHPLRQLGQNDLSGPFEPRNITLVIYQCLNTDKFITELRVRNWHFSQADANAWIKRYQPDFADKTTDGSDNRYWILRNIGRVF